MALHKCPKCELNYIREGEDYCEVCKREMKRAQARSRQTEEENEDDEVILCSECGEAPAVRGGDLCISCFKEKKRQVVLENAQPCRRTTSLTTKNFWKATRRSTPKRSKTRNNPG